MWTTIVTILGAAKSLWDSLKRKPEPLEVPIPVDTQKAKDLLNPKEKK